MFLPMAMWSSHCQDHYLALHEGVLPAWTCECILGATQQETQPQPQLTSTTTLGRNSTFVLQARNLKVEILTNWSQRGFSSSASRLCRDKCSINWLRKNSHCCQGGMEGAQLLRVVLSILPERHQSSSPASMKGTKSFGQSPVCVMGKWVTFSSPCLCRKSEDTITTVPSGCRTHEYPFVLTGVFRVHVASLFQLCFTSADISELHQGWIWPCHRVLYCNSVPPLFNTFGSLIYYKCCVHIKCVSLSKEKYANMHIPTLSLSCYQLINHTECLWHLLKGMSR